MHRLFASSWRYWITKIIKARQISQCSSHGFLPYKCTYLRADVASHPLHSWTKWRSPLRKFRLLLMESFKQSGCKSQNWPVLLKNNGKKKPRESLVSKQTEYWVPVSWGLCAVVGFRNDWFAFCKCGVIFACFPLFETEFLLCEVFATVWKVNTKRGWWKAVCHTDFIQRLYEIYTFKRASLLFLGGNPGSWVLLEIWLLKLQ